MKRSDFIKSLGLGASGIIIPNNAFLNYKNIKIYDNYVRGLHHYKYQSLKTKLQEGDSLVLKRELSNRYDNFAIAIYYQELKLGYIAAYENIVLANMMDNHVALECFVSKHDTKANPFHCLAVQVFSKLIVPTQELIQELLTHQPADDVKDVYRKGHKF